MKQFLTAATLAVLAGTALADTTTVNGLTFNVTVDADFFNPPPGKQYGYSYVTVGNQSTAGMWGNFSEWEVLRSEFNITNLDSASSATLSFRFKGSYLGQNFNPSYPPNPTFSVGVGTYFGDNQAQVGDYYASLGSGLASIQYYPLAVDTVFTFDVTSQFQAALAAGAPALGVGMNIFTPDKFASFDNFTLTVTNVPEPSTYALMFAGLGLLGVAHRRKAPSHALGG